MLAVVVFFSLHTLFSGYFAKWLGITVMLHHARIDVIVYVCVSVCVRVSMTMMTMMVLYFGSVCNEKPAS